MKFKPALLVVLFLSIVISRHVAAENLPEFRPALPISGPHSLVNLINVDSVYKRGQKTAVVMFSCWVTSLGYAGGMVTYRCSPNSEILQKEARDRCNYSQFEPPVFRHNRVNAWISGTIYFVVIKDTPHLRVFLNQEDHDLLHGSDFVAPQYVDTTGNTKFDGVYWPPNAPGHSGMAALKLTIDTQGNVLASQVAHEYPPNMGFGTASGAIRDAWFIPGFRNGKVVQSQFVFPMIFRGSGRQMKTG